jgi:putative two-component system response regulator
VGKIGIPDRILRKAGALDECEYEIMKRHCTGGSQIIRHENEGTDSAKQHADLGSLIFQDLHSPVMRMAALVAETHHERWDGQGYPRGLTGSAIPIEGRITAVADVFDALSTKRHYKPAIPLPQCFKIIAENSGTQFDPDVVQAFFRRRSEIERTYRDYSDL